MPIFIHTVGLCFLWLSMSGCSEKEEKFDEKPVEELYGIAEKQYFDKNYLKSAKFYDEVERQHPYSDHSILALKQAGYCYYLSKKYDEAIERFQTFVQLHPSHAEIAFCYHMIGLCHYEQIPIVQRDQMPAKDAMEAFNEVINRFPDSSYAQDARLKNDLILDHLAAKEMAVGRYYQSGEHAPLSAMNRYRLVVDQYQTTSQAPEALYRLVECYLAEGMNEEALKMASVLGHNHNTSEWYKRAYELVKNLTSSGCVLDPKK